MHSRKMSRRHALGKSGLAVTGALALPAIVATPAIAAGGGKSKPSFVFCLNTATIRGQNLGIVKEIGVAAKAGYQAIEPWVSSLEDYVKQGGKLKDIAKRLKDSGLTMESAIGFPEWIVDNDTQRAKGLERAKYELDLVAQAGGKRLAAPPSGATNNPGMDLQKAAERYRALLDIGDQIGVLPQLELWGFSKNFHRLGQCIYAAVESGHPKACVLVDVYHLYKGGSDIHGMKLLAAETIHVLHMNDYPANPPRSSIGDEHRVLPGEGIAPLNEILQILRNSGGEKILSLEVFNKRYWEQDALKVARLGLEKMKASVKQASGT